jgi:hypothetical protein
VPIADSETPSHSSALDLLTGHILGAQLFKGEAAIGRRFSGRYYERRDARRLVNPTHQALARFWRKWLQHLPAPY